MNQTSAPCPLCSDTGWHMRGRMAQRCECRIKSHAALLWEMAGVPWRWRDASFSSYSLNGHLSRFEAAHILANGFAQKYPVIEERGLVMIGTCGTGKTHLGVSVLRELTAKGIACRFCDYAELIEQMRASYHPESDESARNLVAPFLEVEVLLLDDLGAVRGSEWVLEQVLVLLNTRYKHGRPTIITTNYRDAALAELDKREIPLQDRVGARVVSRLHEMCRFVTMEGPDYRMTMHRPLKISASAIEGHA